MNFFKILLTFIYLLFSSVVYADSHDAQQNIVEKAKEINQKIKKDQALKAANNQNAAGKEEPLPLNDPFVGDGSLGGTGGVELIANSDEDKRKLSVFNFKLVGVIGLGRIGSNVANFCSNLNAKVIFYDNYRKKNYNKKIKKSSINFLLKKSQALFLGGRGGGRGKI